MSENITMISCPLFQKQEFVTKEITDKINVSAFPKTRIRFAEELLKEIDIISKCPEYKHDNFECRNCRTISFVRKETAELIIQARKNYDKETS